MHQKKEGKVDLNLLDIETLMREHQNQLIAFLIGDTTTCFDKSIIMPKLIAWRNKKTGCDFLQQVLIRNASGDRLSAFSIVDKQNKHQFVEFFNDSTFNCTISKLKKYDEYFIHNKNNKGQTALDILVEYALNISYKPAETKPKTIRVNTGGRTFLVPKVTLEMICKAIEALVFHGFYCNTVTQNNEITRFLTCVLLNRELKYFHHKILPYLSILTFNYLNSKNSIEQHKLCIGINFLHSMLKLRPEFMHANTLFTIMKDCLCSFDRSIIRYDPTADKFVIKSFKIAPDAFKSIKILVEDRNAFLHSIKECDYGHAKVRCPQYSKIENKEDCFQVLLPLFDMRDRNDLLKNSLINDLISQRLKKDWQNNTKKAAYNYFYYTFLKDFLNCIDKMQNVNSSHKVIPEKSMRFKFLFLLMDEKHNMLFQKLVDNVHQRINCQFNNGELIQLTWMHYAIQINNLEILQILYESGVSPNIPIEYPASKCIHRQTASEIKEFANSHCFWNAHALYEICHISGIVSVCMSISLISKALSINISPQLSLNFHSSVIDKAFFITFFGITNTIIAFKPHIVPDTIVCINRRLEQSKQLLYKTQESCNIL